MITELLDSVVRYQKYKRLKFKYPKIYNKDTNKGKFLHPKVRIGNVDIYVRSPKYPWDKKAIYFLVGLVVGMIIGILF